MANPNKQMTAEQVKSLREKLPFFIVQYTISGLAVAEVVKIAKQRTAYRLLLAENLRTYNPNFAIGPFATVAEAHLRLASIEANRREFELLTKELV